ncbi:hypothetical protein [Sphingobacterium sp. IITKGP-BTPF85]|uniref:hypothetical protein n=1 Tax=Sphingobacterium sp. IITKGP-BTPF85 TaxID=1338009 RepID=UPI00038A3AE2|nr:hypothetical protein [Sphingobacterium sp. IITKGP-BTPF85]KKX49362.1 hypothetical protein L950_0215985 [Sphingobacterium sp. IITKGP-BTPF85]
MGYKEVINNLSDFSTSRLNTISRLYNIDVETSNVNILYKAFEKIVDENLKRDETGINPSKLLSHEQVVDMQYNISLAVEMYKIKYNRRTVPSHFNLFHLIQDFNILNPAK